MSGPESPKTLLAELNQKRYRAFILNNDENELITQIISPVPGVAASKRKDVYTKNSFPKNGAHQVKFIAKNGHTQGFIWHTTPDQIKVAVRWGIINTQSITGKVISSLGNYRIAAHERAAKGMISNSQVLKLKLLDLYQDRFEALQALESLVNRNNSYTTYETHLQEYIQRLNEISTNLEGYFNDVDHQTSGLKPTAIDELKADIQRDISRTRVYLNSLIQHDDLRAANRARGKNSIMEFVKNQMHQGLYELQGLNQDITFNKHRDFALTRGRFNDFIEAARAIMEHDQADPRNEVTPKHHGLYSDSEHPNTPITYDFTEDQLSHAREREVLLAISFIERWDILDISKDKAPRLRNGTGVEDLDIIAATKWKTHRNFKALLKSVGYFAFNIIKGIFVPTHSWEEEAWNNPNFHLFASTLRAQVTPVEPMWRKPLKFLKQIAHAIMDIFNGIRDFGAQLVIKMPDDILNDWESTQDLEPLIDTIKAAERELNEIQAEEDSRLRSLLKKCHYNEEQIQTLLESAMPQNGRLARAEYSLTPGEQNDILTGMAKGLTAFGGVFSKMYAEDPIAGLLFTAAYSLGAATIYFPVQMGGILGANYVQSFSNFAYSMASSKFGAVLTGATTQGQVTVAAWDNLIHGPNSITVDTLYKFGEDPLTFGAYIAAAYGIGHVLINGIAGYKIPWLSDHLRADLGTKPQAGYPFIGGKVALGLYEILSSEDPEEFIAPQWSSNAESEPSEEQQKILNQRFLVHWLSQHAQTIPKLHSKHRFALSRHIEVLFTKEEADSLKKIIYPESQPSIAFQLLSIPLSYIPALIHLGLALGLSLAAAIAGKSHPLEPSKRAGIYLWDKVKKDLSRLIVFATHMAYIPYFFMYTLTKALVYTVTLIIGRVASLFDASPAHDIHQFFAAVHIAFRQMAEFLYPARALKHVVVAHPANTMGIVEESYVTCMSELRGQRHYEAQTLNSPGVEVASSPSKAQSLPLADLNYSEATSAQGLNSTFIFL